VYSRKDATVPGGWFSLPPGQVAREIPVPLQMVKSFPALGDARCIYSEGKVSKAAWKPRVLLDQGRLSVSSRCLTSYAKRKENRLAECRTVLGKSLFVFLCFLSVCPIILLP